MANKKFWLGMLAIALVFGMTVIGCEDDSSGDEQKVITITGITGKTGHVTITLFPDFGDDSAIVAGGMETVSNDSVTFLLYDMNIQEYTGSDPYFILLNFDEDDDDPVLAAGYIYTEGKTYTQLGISTEYEDELLAKIPKYATSSVTSTIPFTQFIVFNGVAHPGH
jgi:hypothetical protein